MKKYISKKLLAIMLVLGIVTTGVFPSTSFATEMPVSEVADSTKEDKKTDTGGSTILLSTDVAPTETFGAVTVEQLAGVVKLVYASSSEAKKAYDTYREQGYVVEYDTTVTMIDDTATQLDEVDTSEVEVSEIETVEDLLTEEVEIESEQGHYSKVAVIDTGCDLAAIPGRIAEGTDTAITDANGHGTLMAEIIASQTADNVKILPIKAFDDNGISTVAQVYAAIQTACNMGVDVISLSMAGEGHSTMLTNAINHAASQGITVVVAAGNNASDVSGYMPGNIENAITVSATDENKVFAEYSNYGDRIDFAATGTIIKDHGTEDTSDDEIFQGTSIASAYVAGYVAFIFDNNENADIKKNLIASAEDRGDVGKDNYYGNGYLSLDTLSFNINADGSLLENEKPEENVDEEEDEKQEITTAAKKTTWELDVSKSGYGDKDGKYNGKANKFWNSTSNCGMAIVCAVNDAFNTYGYTTLTLHVKDNSTWTDQLTIPAGKKLVLYGEGETGKTWRRTAPNSINSSNIYLLNGATLECHNMKFLDETTKETSFNHAPGCISGCNFEDKNTYGTVKCYDCYFKSNSHWWSVSSGNKGHFENCTFDNTSGKGNFGALCLFNGGTVKKCTFKGRVDSKNGMSRALTLKGTTTVKNCTINGYGGMNPAVETDGNLNISNTTIDNYGNSGVNAKCLKNNSGTTSITNCTIKNADIGVQNLDTFNLNSGDIYSNEQTGIYNNGVTNVLNGNIYSNKNGVINRGTATIKGGLFYENNAHGIRNTGTLTVSPSSQGAVKCYLNKKSGLCNTGTATINGGWFGGWYGAETYGNTEHGIYNGYDTDDNKNITSFGKITINGSGVSTVAWHNGTSGIYNISYNPSKKTDVTATINYCDIKGNKYGIYNNGGATTIADGSVYNNKTNGVLNNAGTFTISGGVVRDNSDGIRNLGSTIITGATIQSNTNGVVNQSSGTTTINGTAVAIQNNSYGVLNTAEKNGVTITNATITGNTTADLGQSGEMMKISGRNTNTNIIELGVGSDGKPEIVTIDGVPAKEKLVVLKNDEGTMTAQQRTDNMTIERPMFYCINTTPSAVLSKLAFKDSAQKTLVNGTKRPAVMRPGNGKNGADASHIVLSTKYLATYKVNDKIDGFTFSVPDAVALFWKEDVNIDSLPKLMAKVGGVLSEFPILGWLKDGMGKVYEVGASMLFGSNETQKDHEIVAQMGLCNLYIYGNGQTEGEDYVIKEFNCATDKLPKNTFKKEFKDNYYYIELGEQKQHETKYSYQGWSLSKDANYLSNGVMKEQGKLDFADVAAYMESHKDTLTYGKNGLPNIPIYAVWDQYPELKTEDISIVSNWVDKKTDAELSKILYENVKGEDTEDGTLANGKEDKGVICTDFDKDEIRQLKHTGTVTVTFQATDGVGNVTERKVRVYVNSSNPIEPFDPNHPEKGGVYLNRARCINKEYYEAGKGYAEGDLTGYKKGGLMPTDWWYTDAEYANLITEAFDNLENDSPEITWYFTHEQVLETQDWIDEHGFGNSEEKDALKKYFEKYKATYKKLK